MQTKADFPNFKTRGKVTENRMDVELESKGSIFQGRDEKNILTSKREQQQFEMKQALQAQMEEKTRKKEAEKFRLQQEEMREE
jgi:hypothetical protein